MTEPNEPPPQPTEPEVLSYRPPADEPGRLSPPIVCAIAIGTGLVVFGIVFLALALSFGGRGLRGLPLVLIPAALAALVVCAVRLREGKRGRSVAMGIWIGIGIGLLAEGICFGVIFL